MGTQYPEIFAALAAPFDPAEVKTRSQGGRNLSYITARTAANRLDDVLGCECWRQEYRETKGGLICRLWYRLGPDQEWNWKEDGGGFANMPEGDNNEKSGFSDSFKRACAMIGVARYLYRDGIPHYGEVPNEPAPPPRQQAQRPAPPPRDPGPVGRRQQEHDARNQGQRRDYGDAPPRNGKGLWARCKELQEQHGRRDLIDDVQGYIKRQGYPGRMVDLSEDQVADVFREVQAMLGIGAAPAMAGGGHDDDGDDSTIPF